MSLVIYDVATKKIENKLQRSIEKNESIKHLQSLFSEGYSIKWRDEHRLHGFDKSGVEFGLDFWPEFPKLNNCDLYMVYPEKHFMFSDARKVFGKDYTVTVTPLRVLASKTVSKFFRSNYYDFQIENLGVEVSRTESVGGGSCSGVSIMGDPSTKVIYRGPFDVLAYKKFKELENTLVKATYETFSTANKPVVTIC